MHTHISLIGKSEPIVRPMGRWEDNIKMDLKETRGAMVWTGFVWLRTGQVASFFNW
jgi:hypothetical protein